MVNKWELKYKRKCLKEQTAARDVWQGYRGKSHEIHSEVCRHWEGSTISLQYGDRKQSPDWQSSAALKKKPLFYLHLASTGRLSPAVLVYQAVCKSISISLPLSSVWRQSLSYAVWFGSSGSLFCTHPAGCWFCFKRRWWDQPQQVLKAGMRPGPGWLACVKAPRTKVLGWM